MLLKHSTCRSSRRGAIALAVALGLGQLLTPPAVALNFGDLISSDTKNILSKDRSYSYHYLAAPEFILPDIKRLALMPSNGGELLDNRLYTAFTKWEQPTHFRADGEPPFTLFERRQLETLLREQNFSTSGLVDESQAVSIGKIAGVDAVVLATLSASKPRDVNYTKVESQYDEETETSYDVNVPYIRREASLTISTRLVSVETGEILAIIEEDALETQEVRAEDSGQLMSQEQMLAICEEQALSDVATRIRPHRRRHTVEFIEYKTKDKSARQLGRDAFKLAAKDGRLEEAFEIWCQLRQSDPYSAPLQANIGSVLEAYGVFDKAMEQYEVAKRLAARDRNEDFVDDAIARINTMERHRRELKRLGIRHVPGDLTLEECDNADEAARTVEVKGSSSRRRGLYATSKLKKQVLEVPGGTTLTVISEQKDSLEVEDPLSGKKLFISKNDVK